MAITSSGVAKLRNELAAAANDKQVKSIIEARDEALARYHPVFTFERIPDLGEDAFRGFLLFKNNRHWTGLKRKGDSLCSNMPRLREGLLTLLDQAQPIKQRLDKLIPKGGPPFMDKLGKALLTAVLHVAYPDAYGVYNGTSEAGMRAAGVLPSFERGSSFGERYVKINDTLLALASELKIDLWTLDALWWPLAKAPPLGRQLLEAAEQIQARSQGISVSPAARKAIETHAMNEATAHFERAGYRVRDVSRHKSYDLHCERKDAEICVEVKGTQTVGDEILLTPGEVRLARKRSPQTALFVVHSVKVVETCGKATAEGGQVRILQPWNPDEKRLQALGYSYELPQE